MLIRAENVWLMPVKILDNESHGEKVPRNLRENKKKPWEAVHSVSRMRVKVSGQVCCINEEMLEGKAGTGLVPVCLSFVVNLILKYLNISHREISKTDSRLGRKRVI